MLHFFLPPRQDITSLTCPNTFARHKLSGYPRLGKIDFQRQVHAAKKSFQLVSCLEDIIVYGEVFDVARF